MKEASRSKPRSTGFTLIELMIAVVIVGILASIAYPSYRNYVIKSNRSAAESFLLIVAGKQEQYMLDARQYATGATALTTLGVAVPSEVSPNYSVTAVANNGATPPSYTISAIPIGSQLASDTACGTVTIDQTGTKGVTGTGSATQCW